MFESQKRWLIGLIKSLNESKEIQTEKKATKKKIQKNKKTIILCQNGFSWCMMMWTKKKRTKCTVCQKTAVGLFQCRLSTRIDVKTSLSWSFRCHTFWGHFLKSYKKGYFKGSLVRKRIHIYLWLSVFFSRMRKPRPWFEK